MILFWLSLSIAGECFIPVRRTAYIAKCRYLTPPFRTNGEAQDSFNGFRIMPNKNPDGTSGVLEADGITTFGFGSKSAAMKVGIMDSEKTESETARSGHRRRVVSGCRQSLFAPRSPSRRHRSRQVNGFRVDSGRRR